ncbi:MAG: SRPBCC family protein [Pseudomonadota bacterium]|nr:SRPBCC family protein [Pseudomonadota bacterium]
MLAALVLTLAAFAADPAVPHEHQGVVAAYKGAPPAVPLAAEEAAKLTSGEMVLKQVKTGNGGHGVVFMDINATPTTIWNRIVNYAMYPTWVDNVAACEVYRKDGASIYTRFVLDPMGMSVEYFIKHTYNPTAGWLTWTLDYGRLSDLDESVGYWRITPLTTDPPRSRLEYSVDIRFKGWIPGFAQDMIAKQGLTNAVTWVKKQSEGG